MDFLFKSDHSRGANRPSNYNLLLLWALKKRVEKPLALKLYFRLSLGHRRNNYCKLPHSTGWVQGLAPATPDHSRGANRRKVAAYLLTLALPPHTLQTCSSSMG